MQLCGNTPHNHHEQIDVSTVSTKHCTSIHGIQSWLGDRSTDEIKQICKSAHLATQSGVRMWNWFDMLQHLLTAPKPFYGVRVRLLKQELRFKINMNAMFLQKFKRARTRIRFNFQGLHSSRFAASGSMVCSYHCNQDAFVSDCSRITTITRRKPYLNLEACIPFAKYQYDCFGCWIVDLDLTKLTKLRWL